MKLCWGMKQGVAVLLSAVLLLAQLHWCEGIFRTETGDACPESLALHTAEHSDYGSELHAPDEDCHKGCQAALCSNHPATDYASSVSNLQPDSDFVLAFGPEAVLAPSIAARAKRLFHLFGSPPHGPPKSVQSRGPPASLPHA
jgi:hypothetical protein